jgi:hypothetical protein
MGYILSLFTHHLRDYLAAMNHRSFFLIVSSPLPSFPYSNQLFSAGLQQLVSLSSLFLTSYLSNWHAYGTNDEKNMPMK